MENNQKVQKSLEEVKAEGLQVVNQVKQEAPKRGRGRPKKNPQAQSPIQKNSPEPRGEGLKLTFKAIFDFIGKTLAITLTFKRFEIDEQESELLSNQADEVVSEFVPEVHNKWAKLGIFLVSLITIFGRRFLEYEKDQAKQRKEKFKNSDENKNKTTVIELT